MNEQVKKEIIKAYAYDKTDAEVADAMGITPDEAAVFRIENEKAIADKRAELKEAGFFG